MKKIKVIHRKVENKLFFSSLYLLLLLSCIACNGPEPQKEFKGDKQFRTTDPSRLYFNNIRSTVYYRKRKPRTRIDMYTHRKISYNNKRPIIQPIIVNNWMEDEAYIFIEKNDYIYGWPDTLTVQRYVSDSIVGHFSLAIPTRPAMYEFAGKLFEAINNREKLKIKDKNGSLQAIFVEYQDRNAFLTTMRDYYRLTEVF